MKRGLFLLGLGICAAVTGTVTYLYRTDDDVRRKVDDAARSVRALSEVVAERVRDAQAVRRRSYEDEVARNQAWADEQWDAIGI